MNRQTPLRTPQRPNPERERMAEKQPPKNPLAKLLMILLLTAAALVIACVITVVIVLATGGDDVDAKDPSGDKNQTEQNDSDKDGRGAVATSPSRASYAIGNASDYRTMSGIATKNAILVDLNSYEAIAGVDPDAEICPASMTKVMTVLVVAEHLTSLDDRLTVTADVLNESLKSGGSGMKDLWIEGNEFSVEDLMYLAHMQSDTVACKLLANYICKGGEAEFTDLMNQKAREIGMTNTVFNNSTGLYVPGQTYRSTCRDVAMLMAYAMDNPLANRILTANSRVLKKEYAPLSERITIKPTWITERLGNATLETVTVKGGKTGYETNPGYCLVSYAESRGGSGRYVLVTVGGSGVKLADTIKDVKTIYNTYAD